MDALTKALLDALVEKGSELAQELVLEGVALVRARLSGEPTDAAVLQWLRAAQGGGGRA